MTHAIIRGKNGQRHEVDFEDAPVKVEVYAGEETVEIFAEADFETHAEQHRRFAILNIPRHLFSEAAGKAAQRASRKERYGSAFWAAGIPQRVRPGSLTDLSSFLFQQEPPM